MQMVRLIGKIVKNHTEDKELVICFFFNKESIKLFLIIKS